MIIGKAISPFALRKKNGGGGGNDPDAQLFITATGISGTNATATNQLVLDLKSANIWNKMKAVYPLVGGTATSHKFNLLNPSDTNGAFRLVFAGGVTHSSTGVLFGGVNGWADTFMNMSTNFSTFDVHLSANINSDFVGTLAQGHIGANAGATSCNRLGATSATNETSLLGGTTAGTYGILKTVTSTTYSQLATVATDGSNNIYAAGFEANGGYGGQATATWIKTDSSGALQTYRTFTNNAGGATYYYGIKYNSVGNLDVVGSFGTGESINQLPADGSKTGTYTVNSISVTYATATTAIATSTLTDTTGTSIASGVLTEATGTGTDAAGSQTSYLTLL